MVVESPARVQEVRVRSTNVPIGMKGSRMYGSCRGAHHCVRQRDGNMRIKWAKALIGWVPLLSLMLAGCGGADPSREVSVLRAPPAHAPSEVASAAVVPAFALTPEAAPDTDRRHALALSDHMSVSMLLDWAQGAFPILFPAGTSTEWGVFRGVGYLYRYYPATGNYLGVTLDGAVWAYGPFTGDVVTPFGQMTDYTCLVVPNVCTSSTQGAKIDKVYPRLTNASGRTEYVVEGGNLPGNQGLALSLEGCADPKALVFGSRTQVFSCVLSAQAAQQHVIFRLQPEGPAIGEADLALKETFGLLALLSYTGPVEAPWVKLATDPTWLKSVERTSGVPSWIAHLNLPRSNMQDLRIEYDRAADCEFMSIHFFTDERRRVPSGFVPNMSIHFDGELVTAYSGLEDHGQTPSAMPSGHYELRFSRDAQGTLNWSLTHPDGSRTGGPLESDGLMTSRSHTTEAHEQVWINTWIHGLGQKGCAFQNLRITDRGQVVF